MPMMRIRGEVPVGQRYRLSAGLTVLVWLLMIVPVVGVVALGFPPLLAPLLWIGASLAVTALTRSQIEASLIRAQQHGLVAPEPAPDPVMLELPDPTRRDAAWDDAEAELDQLRERLISHGRHAVYAKTLYPETLRARLTNAEAKLVHAQVHRTISDTYWEDFIVPAKRAVDEVYLAIGEHAFGTTLATCAALPALKRPFRLVTDCQHGHVGEHLVTAAPTKDRVGRACCMAGCTSTWTEWA